MFEEHDSHQHEIKKTETEKIIDERNILVSTIKQKRSVQLRRWNIRTAIGCVIFGLLYYQFTWGKWLFYLYLILSTLSLVSILIGYFIVKKKINDLDKKLALLNRQASSINDAGLE